MIKAFVVIAVTLLAIDVLTIIIGFIAGIISWIFER